MLIDTEHGVKPRFLTPQIIKDFAGNLFVAATYYDDENQYQGYCRVWKIAPDGTKTTLGDRNMTRAKGDGVGICQSGTDILVLMGGHFHDPDTDLELLPAYQGVAVAYPTGMQPGHGGAQAYTETQQAGGDPVDYDRITQIVHAEVAAATTTIVGNIKPKVQAAIKDLNMWSQSMQDRGIDKWFKDRNWQTFDENVPGFWPWLAAKVHGTSAPKDGK